MKLRLSVATAAFLTLCVTPATIGVAWFWRGPYFAFYVLSTPLVWMGLTAAVAVVLACFVRDE